MAADQALEWEVVTANGTLVTATPTKNSDLYWALSGGGGGTYGVVLSLTVRAYVDTIVGGVSFVLPSPSGSVDDDNLWDAISFFYRYALASIVDAGAHVQGAVFGPTFILSEVTIPGLTEDEMRSVMKPFTDYLNDRAMQYQMNVTSYSGFYEHADHYVGPFPHGVAYSAQIQGGVMISRETLMSNSTGPELIARLRHISTATDFTVLPYSFNGWRDLLAYIVISQQWNYSVPFSVMDEQERKLTEDIMPPMQELASGAYLSEADFRNPKWKEEFYGVNWARLSEIKSKWDPESLLYATTAVGSDEWEADANGRLCRV
jgi:FAD/FMN-containing dehydrogenase